MERQYHNEDFERLLRDNANQYRMYPSEKVWKGVYAAIHTRRRWYRFSAVLLLLIGVSVGTVSVLTRNSEKPVAATSADTKKLQPANIASENISEPAANDRSLVSREPLTPQNKPEKHPTFYNHPVFNPVPAHPANLSTVSLQPDESLSINGASLLTETTPQPVIVQSLNNDPGETIAFSKVQMTEELKLSSTPSISPAPPANMNEAIEKAVSALASQNAPIQVKGKTAKVTAQVYFTPTVSYRKLSENKAYSRTVSAQNPSYNYTQYVDVNNVVNHKPAMGLEVGIEGRYAITDKISVKMGTQFNINRYDIRAYFHPTEFATIALNSASPPDSVVTLSNYRNFNGANANWLENFYFTVSAPLGAEFIFLDNKKVQWGIAGSVQPTYVIGDRAYLISSDYKNYSKVPNLMRRWNINTAIETFVSYSTGRLKWQVGPQLRYQHLSSFVNEVPVKENLFDIGLKIGASINKK